MNYGELKAQVASYLHRTDLDAEIPDFIDRARERLNRRFLQHNPMFTHDSHTDPILTEWPDLYLYASLTEGYGFLHNGPAMSSWDIRFTREADHTNINHPGVATDVYTEPPVIVPYTGA